MHESLILCLGKIQMFIYLVGKLILVLAKITKMNKIKFETIYGDFAKRIFQALSINFN